MFLLLASLRTAGHQIHNLIPRHTGRSQQPCLGSAYLRVDVWAYLAMSRFSQEWGFPHRDCSQSVSMCWRWSDVNIQELRDSRLLPPALKPEAWWSIEKQQSPVMRWGWGGVEKAEEGTILVSDGAQVLDSPFASLSLRSRRHTCIGVINPPPSFKLAQVGFWHL